MGFFSEIVSEARQGINSGTSRVPAPSVRPTPVSAPSKPVPTPAPSVSKPAPAPPVAAPGAPAARPVPTPSSPAKVATPPQALPQANPVPSVHTQPPPEVNLSAEDATQAPDDTAARQAHEAAEAKREAEWDAKQAEKQAKRQAVLDRIKAMNDADLLSAAVGRVAADTEKLTRRNMKEAVAEHIQAKCREDAAFAMLVMDPEKSMIHCFQYINRMAKKFIEEAIKAETPDPESGIYGDDVPDDLVYQWAADYFNDQNAKEDNKNEEKFVPKPYVPAVRKKASSKSGTTGKKPEKKKPAPEKPPKGPESEHAMEQISLM